MRFTVFGEILWDIFGEDKKIGGAPFNFAAHALKLGAQVQLISAVGCDKLGDMALAECEKLGLSTESIARLEYPTGSCRVSLANGIPTYDIVEDVAYDHIPAGRPFIEGGAEIQDIHGKCRIKDEAPDVFYFGTLAQRSKDSEQSLKRILDELNTTPETGREGDSAGPGCQVILDINIRQNYYTSELIDRSIASSTILKISREEIGVLGLGENCGEVCRKLMEKYDRLELVIVTLDSDGAFAFERSGNVTYSPKPGCNVVSTVGAGDAFTAGFLVSYLRSGNIEEALGKASALAGFVCEHTEAIPEYTSQLMEFMKS